MWRCESSRRTVMWFVAVLLGGGVASPASAQLPAGTWQYLWGDEFTLDTLDAKKWSVNYPWGSTHNHDAYMDPDNVVLGDGTLTLVAQRIAQGGKPFTSGAVTTGYSKFTLSGGYVEARIRLPTDVLVRPTFHGDTDLDGDVDADDYFRVDRAFLAAAPAAWPAGDFDYDGWTTGDDYFLLDTAFLLSRPLAPARSAAPTPVPEPTLAPLVTLLLAGLSLRMRAADDACGPSSTAPGRRTGDQAETESANHVSVVKSLSQVRRLPAHFAARFCPNSQSHTSGVLSHRSDAYFVTPPFALVSPV